MVECITKQCNRIFLADPYKHFAILMKFLIFKKSEKFFRSNLTKKRPHRFLVREYRLQNFEHSFDFCQFETFQILNDLIRNSNYTKFKRCPLTIICVHVTRHCVRVQPPHRCNRMIVTIFFFSHTHGMNALLYSYFTHTFFNLFMSIHIDSFFMYAFIITAYYYMRVLVSIFAVCVFRFISVSF